MIFLIWYRFRVLRALKNEHYQVPELKFGSLEQTIFNHVTRQARRSGESPSTAASLFLLKRAAEMGD